MKRCFLGANSGRGFVSLYEGFPPEGVYLHVIKGGPGTGKSSLMKALAARAEEQGLETCRILCSGDPDSLDGLYIPERKLAWADGTAPHVLEPALFGVTGEYWDLTPFFVLPFSREEKDRLLELQRRYRSRYREAYGLLGACAALGGAAAEEAPGEALRAETEGLPRRGKPGRLSRCFLSAVSCKGLLRLEEELRGLRIVSAAPSALAEAAREAQRKGWDAILCLSPLVPEQAEALLLPEAGLAATVIHRPGEASREYLERATELLAGAKELHDRMEEITRPHMDFEALSRFTGEKLKALFPE